jgi:hypothetical protein
VSHDCKEHEASYEGNSQEGGGRIGPPDNKPMRCDALLPNGKRCPCGRYNGRTDLDPENPAGELCGTPIGIYGVCGHRRDEHSSIIS